MFENALVTRWCLFGSRLSYCGLQPVQADAHPENEPRLIGKTPNPLVFDDSSVLLMLTVSHLKLMNPNLDESLTMSFLGGVRLINIVCLSREALIHQTDAQ